MKRRSGETARGFTLSKPTSSATGASAGAPEGTVSSLQTASERFTWRNSFAADTGKEKISRRFKPPKLLLSETFPCFQRKRLGTRVGLLLHHAKSACRGHGLAVGESFVASGRVLTSLIPGARA